MVKWRRMRTKPAPFELTLRPPLLKREGEKPVSPSFSSQEKGVGGMSSNERLAKNWHFLALDSNLTSSAPVQLRDMGQDQSFGRGLG